MKYEKHIGIIVPSSGIVTEMLFHQYAPRGIGVSTVRVKFNQITFQGLSDMLNMVGQAAEDLCCVDPSIIVFSSVMAGAINGKAVTNIVEQTTGIPCITGFYALLEAIEALHIENPTVVSPHPDHLNLVFKRKMLQSGVRVKNICPLQQYTTEKSIRALEQISMEDILSSLKDVDLTGSDALVVNAACIQSSGSLRDAEKDLGIPILQGDQATLWSALRSVGDGSRIPELGKIFEV